MKIVIGSDHGGFELKQQLKQRFADINIDVIDIGNEGLDSVDYPDYAAQVSDKISRKEADAGVLVCGTGIGMCITANKFKNVRAAVLYDDFTAKMSKAHNNANVICLGGRTIDPDVAWKLISIWLETEYEGGRHEHRLSKIKEIESKW